MRESRSCGAIRTRSRREPSASSPIASRRCARRRSSSSSRSSLPSIAMAQAAAFFDLDRTLIRRSSALALARPFRDHGLISRRQLVAAGVWQVLFVLRGASHRRVQRASEDGLMLLRGMRPEEMRALVTDSLEDVLRPLVYAEPVSLVAQH